MIDYKEYNMLKKIIKDPFSPELNTLAMQPDFMYEFKATKYVNDIGKYIKKNNALEKNEELVNQFYWKGNNYNIKKYDNNFFENLEIISKLMTRDLISIGEKNITKRKNKDGRVLRYFILTDKGYNSLFEYRSRYKFWIPIIISICSIVISIFFK